MYYSINKNMASSVVNYNYWYKMVVENETGSLRAAITRFSSRRESIKISWAEPEISKRLELTNRGHQHRNLFLPRSRYFRIHARQPFTTLACVGQSILIKSF